MVHQFSIFFAKISWIGPLVSRINWCEGHWFGSTYMVVRLSDKRKTHKKKCIFVFLGCFWAYVGQPDDHRSWATSMPFASFHCMNLRTNPWKKKNENWRNWKMSFFFSRPFWIFFCFIPIKTFKFYWLARFPAPKSTCLKICNTVYYAHCIYMSDYPDSFQFHPDVINIRIKFGLKLFFPSIQIRLGIEWSHRVVFDRVLILVLVFLWP